MFSYLYTCVYYILYIFIVWFSLDSFIAHCSYDDVRWVLREISVLYHFLDFDKIDQKIKLLVQTALNIKTTRKNYLSQFICWHALYLCIN